jgi:organic hydroperoxide reductase OsmC/OhrA
MTAHNYKLTVEWTGNKGTGTSGYRDYERSHTISAASKPEIPGSSDPAFRGDAQRWNPEELLVASASACHKLWYLHLCADAGIVVTAYVDHAEGTMTGDRFERIVLRPHVTIATGDARWHCNCTTRRMRNATSPIRSTSRSTASLALNDAA